MCSKIFFSATDCTRLGIDYDDTVKVILLLASVLNFALENVVAITIVALVIK